MSDLESLGESDSSTSAVINTGLRDADENSLNYDGEYSTDENESDETKEMDTNRQSQSITGQKRSTRSANKSQGPSVVKDTVEGTNREPKNSQGPSKDRRVRNSVAIEDNPEFSTDEDVSDNSIMSKPVSKSSKSKKSRKSNVNKSSKRGKRGTNEQGSNESLINKVKIDESVGETKTGKAKKGSILKKSIYDNAEIAPEDSVSNIQQGVESDDTEGMSMNGSILSEALATEINLLSSESEEDFVNTIQEGIKKQFQPTVSDYIFPLSKRMTKILGVSKKYVPKGIFSTIYCWFVHFNAFLFHIIFNIASVWDSTLNCIHKFIYFSDKISNRILRDREKDN